MNKVVAELITESSDIYSIPEVYSLLSNKLQDPYASNAQIADIIKKDPGLSLVLLKIVNSALYGFKSSISSISQTVSIIGRIELSELVLSTTVIRKLNQLPIEKSKLQQHWKHCILCGLIAKKLAIQCSLKDSSESIFIAGLLHDIGKLLIWHNFSEQIKQNLNRDPFQNIQTEQEILGFNHAELGAELMKAWELPSLLISTTLWHHSPEDATEYFDSCKVINLANILAHFETMADDTQVYLDKYTFWKEFELSLEDLFKIHLIATEELNETIGIFLQ